MFDSKFFDVTLSPSLQMRSRSGRREERQTLRTRWTTNHLRNPGTATSHQSIMMFRLLVFLATALSCSAWTMAPSLASGSQHLVQRSAASVAVAAPRAASPVMRRTAEERDVLELEGTVLEAMRGADFRVQVGRHLMR